MKEKIILAPGANGNELLKSLAKSGRKSINMRICGSVELARIALMRFGISIGEEFIDSREEVLLIAEAQEGEEYFKTADSGSEESDLQISFSDIQEIANAVRTMRSLVPEGDEEEQIGKIMAQGTFTEKNAALFSVYKKYMKLAGERRFADSIMLIRKAIKECGIISLILKMAESSSGKDRLNPDIGKSKRGF